MYIHILYRAFLSSILRHFIPTLRCHAAENIIFTQLHFILQLAFYTSLDLDSIPLTHMHDSQCGQTACLLLLFFPLTALVTS